MSLGSFEDHVIVGLRRTAPAAQLDGLKITFLGSADKCDPLNSRAVMVAEASVRGEPCAWIVECRNDGTQAVQGRLIQGMIAAIAAEPDQIRANAEPNKVIIS